MVLIIACIRSQQMEKVSVIVPVHNSEKYISRCIESLIRQSYKNIEIILINDGSTDRSLSICEKYALKDKRIKLFSITNSGVSIARNLGIEKATGSYITFVDSDDWVEPDMIEFALLKAKENNADVVIWSYYRRINGIDKSFPLIDNNDGIFDKNKDILYLKSINSTHNKNPSSPSVSVGTTWCKLYKKDLILDNNLKFNPKLIRAQDTVFSLNAFYFADKIVYFNKPLYHYEVNDTSISSGKKYINNTLTPFNELLKELYTFVEKIGETKELRNALYIRTIKVLNWHLEHHYFHRDYNKGILKRRKDINKIINSQPYKSALKNAILDKLPRKEKLMTILLRKKLIFLYYMTYKMYNFIRKK